MRNLCCVAALVLVGCSQSPYMEGYKIGHQKGALDKDIDLLGNEIPT